MNFSYYNAPISNTVPSRTVSIVDICEMITKDATLKTITDFYRSEDLNAERKGEFKKTEFPYVTFSGIYKTRKQKDLIKYSNLTAVDIDSITNEELLIIKKFVLACEYVVLAYETPNHGYKIIIRTSSQESHLNTYNSFANFLVAETGIGATKIDRSCVDICRANFICHDGDAFINKKVINGNIDQIEIFPLSENDNQNHKILKAENSFTDDISLTGYKLDYLNKNSENNFRILVGIVEKKYGEYGSPRQTWIQRLASHCNQFGIELEYTLEYFSKYYSSHKESVRADKPIDVESYIVNTVNDTYKRYEDQFQIWDNDIEKANTPILPDKIFEKLPSVLKKIMKLYNNDKRERDMVLLGTIAVISSCFPEYYGIYDNKLVSANLFLFISAPPSSGKGAVAVVKKIGKAIQKNLDDKYFAALKEYEQKMEEYNKSEDKSAPPSKPNKQLFFIPSNSSSTKLIEVMDSNSLFGVLMEPEADTLCQALKADWGSFSDTLRKAFHHESIELQRMSGSLYINIERSYLSVLLTGTPNQVVNLISSVENGLLSRFIFYSFSQKPVWKDVFEMKDELPELAFNNLSGLLESYMHEVRKVANATKDTTRFGLRFRLTQEQGQEFNNYFDKQEQLLYHIYDNDISASVRRHALSTFRLAMILSILRQMDKKEVNTSLLCNNDDFAISLSIIDVLLQHTLKVYNDIKNYGKKANNTPKKKEMNEYFDKLPSEFNFQTALEVAKALGMIPKTAEYRLKIYKQKGMLSHSHNSYKKV